MDDAGFERRPWGRTPDGTEVELIRLFCGAMRLDVSTYGATVVSLRVPDSNGKPGEVVLGYDSLQGYLDDPCCFGCVVGRVANRISNARFVLNGTEYAVDRNHGQHHLHGGARGFHRRVWRAEVSQTGQGPRVELTRRSPDGEQGFPGTVHARVVYALTGNSLRMTLGADAEDDTVVNMTNHAYFNLEGPGRTCLEHELWVDSDRFLDVNEELIPTGGLFAVTGTPFDFSEPKSLGAQIDSGHPLMQAGSGYDHFYVLDDSARWPQYAVRVRAPESGRVMEMRTTCPGFQLYSGNHIPKGLFGRGGEVYGPRLGFCLEAQGYPDAPNRPEFPSVALAAGEGVTHETEYRFVSVGGAGDSNDHMKNR
ncbi:aldose epimerase family protein [Pseudodesulfovibrio senegalensis]|uniref:Aldose 1-epimerase n=1 Tax=Pseudodesulfovibrio senegalensis TaxID=1721087 RepID=A0A6N6N4W6_9BACT|nr:aldose epimerase family protein [Pseudodesulfovibrio senegalensis]KAB1443222.1 galactose mutarotase [Pseudodesulfovibrio senegalensis]